jgi:hypothetical protein
MHIPFVAVVMVLLGSVLGQSSANNSSSSASASSSATTTSSGNIPQITGINASLPLCAIVLPLLF